MNKSFCVLQLKLLLYSTYTAAKMSIYIYFKFQISIYYSKQETLQRETMF